MHRLFILFIIAAAIYFANQYYSSTSYEEAVEEIYSFSSEPAQPIPENCKTLVTNLENAISGQSSGKISLGQVNIAYRKLKACLRVEGFSDAQKDKVIKEIEDRVKANGNQNSGR